MTVDFPTMPVSALKNALNMDHYTLAPDDTMELWQLKIVVVDPSLSEPTWVLRPRARKAHRGSIMALAVPSLNALTLEAAQRLTSRVTKHIVVRPLSRENRRKGRLVREGDGLPGWVWPTG